MPQKLTNLPLGALIKFGKHQVKSETEQPIIWMVADKNHSGFPANSVTLITQKIIDLRALDGKESDEDGNFDYALSNLNQWLNSDATAGTWYTAKHSNDTPPSTGNVSANPYDTRPGFLYYFTGDEKKALLTTSLTVQKGSDVSKSLSTKVFLPSVWEILGSGSYADGSTRLAYFASVDARSPLTSQAYNNVSNTINRPSSVNGYWGYRTRSTNTVRSVTITEEGIAGASDVKTGSTGVRPLINLSSSLKISDTTDSDGCYTVLTQTTPTISGSNTNLGTKSVGFNHTYTVNDADTGTASDSLTVTEYIDNVSIRSYVATKGATNTFAVTGTTWYKLSNGAHTLKITATDGFDTATRTITFTKSVTKLVVQRNTPIAASKMPTRIIVTLVKNVPSNSNVTVEVCNNGFDATPTWEEIETYESGLAHTFSNKTNTAGKWGVNIRVTVDRGAGEGACYITEIGGNFE